MFRVCVSAFAALWCLSVCRLSVVRSRCLPRAVQCMCCRLRAAVWCLERRWERSRFITESCLADDSHLVAFNPQLHLSVAPGALQGKTMPPYISFPSLTNGELSGLSLSASAAAAAAALHGDADEADDSSSVSTGSPIELWVLLSRHVRERQRDLSSKYLAVHIHEGGSRVACPPPPTKQGVYSNGECTLVKIRLDPKVLSAAAAASDRQQQQQQGCRADRNNALTPSLLTALDYVLVVSQYSQKASRRP